MDIGILAETVMHTATKARHIAPQHSGNDKFGDLLQRLLERDQNALAQLYDATVSRVFGLALRIAGNHHDAEEITCDVYSQAWRTAHRYDSQRASVTGWLMLMTRSRALDLLRKRTARTSPDLHPVDTDSTYLQCSEQAADTLAHASQESSRLRGAMTKLSPAQRMLIELAFFEGLSHDQLATRTGLARGTVKSHIRRGLASLKQQLDRVGFSDEQTCNNTDRQYGRGNHGSSVRSA